MNTIKKIRAIIYVLLFVFLGVFLMTMNVSTSQDPIDLADITVEDLENKALYYAEDLIFLDVYATMEDSDVLYAAVMFEDANGDYVVVNMPVNKSTDIWDGVNDYLDDHTMQMGDYEISGYLVCEKNVDVDDKLFDLFEEWVDDLEREGGISVETNNDLRFNYLCDEDGDPAAEMRKSNLVFTILGVVCLVLALVVLYFGVLRRPRVMATAHAAPSYVPQQPAVSIPQQLQNSSTGIASSKQHTAAEQLYLKAKPYRFMGKTPDLKKAFDLHLRAANMGYAPAQYEVGYAYALGFGVDKNPQLAFQWYMKAAQQGDVTSQRNVGQHYSNGLGVYPDQQQARYWYQLAAEKNDTFATLWLAKMYEDGIGGEQDLNKALQLYKQASEKGNHEAKDAYARLAARLQ